MKTLFFSLAIIALLFTGCSGNQNQDQQNQKGTHTHEDGTVHEDHKDGKEPDQEEFTVPADTASQPEHTHPHSGHEHEHDHDHSHDGHDHSH